MREMCIRDSLALEQAVGVGTLDHHGSALQTGFVAVLIIQHLHGHAVCPVSYTHLSLRDQMTAGNKAFLVGQCQIVAAFDGAQAGTKAGNEMCIRDR